MEGLHLSVLRNIDTLFAAPTGNVAAELTAANEAPTACEPCIPICEGIKSQMERCVWCVLVCLGQVRLCAARLTLIAGRAYLRA